MTIGEILMAIVAIPMAVGFGATKEPGDPDTIYSLIMVRSADPINSSSRASLTQPHYRHGTSSGMAGPEEGILFVAG